MSILCFIYLKNRVLHLYITKTYTITDYFSKKESSLEMREMDRFVPYLLFFTNQNNYQLYMYRLREYSQVNCSLKTWCDDSVYRDSQLGFCVF